MGRVVIKDNVNSAACWVLSRRWALETEMNAMALWATVIWVMTLLQATSRVHTVIGDPISVVPLTHNSLCMIRSLISSVASLALYDPISEPQLNSELLLGLPCQEQRHYLPSRRNSLATVMQIPQSVAASCYSRRQSLICATSYGTS